MIKIILLSLCFITYIYCTINCTEQNFPILLCDFNFTSACCVINGTNTTTCINNNTQINECLFGACIAGPCSGCDLSNASFGICGFGFVEMCRNDSLICVNETDEIDFCKLGISAFSCAFGDCSTCGNSFDCGFNGTNMLCKSSFSNISLSSCVNKNDELDLCNSGTCSCIIKPSIPIISPQISPTITPILEQQEDNLTIILVIIVIILFIIIIFICYRLESRKKEFTKI